MEYDSLTALACIFTCLAGRGMTGLNQAWPTLDCDDMDAE